MSTQPPPVPKWRPTPDYAAGDPGPPLYPRGQIVRAVHRRTTHRCQPPGWWRRWREDLAAGTVWRCRCGDEWMLGYNTEGGPHWERNPSVPPLMRFEAPTR